jgi:hypothetical protein
MLSYARNRVGIDVRQHQVLFKCSAPCDRSPLMIENETIPVEHEFILASNRVHVGDHDLIIDRSRGEHVLTKSEFPAVIGGSTDIHDNLRLSY